MPVRPYYPQFLLGPKCRPYTNAIEQVACKISLFVIRTQCYFCCKLGAYTTISILFSRGRKIRGRKISRNSMRGGYLFRGRKISRKIQIREYSENFLHAKNTCYTVCNSDKDDKYIMRQCQQLYARGNVLLRKFHMCSMSVKIQLFNTYCSPMYTAQLWWNHTVASFHRFECCI